MSRLTIVIAMMLALLTGLVLGQLATVVSPDAASIIMTSGGNIEQVRAFYDGMDRYLASGDDAFLELLTPGYQDHMFIEVEAGSSATLLDRLDAMRRSSSAPHFSIEQLTDLGDLVEVRLSPVTPITLDVAGLTATIRSPSYGRDLVRLEGNGIAARWSQDGRVPLIDYQLDAPFAIGPSDAAQISAYRVVLDPGAELEHPGDAPFGLLLEEDSLTLSTSTSIRRLDPGSDLWVEPEGPARIANRDSRTAMFWLVSIGIIRANSEGIDGMLSAAKQPAVTIERLAWSAPYSWLSNPTGLRLRVARVTLPPGGQLVGPAPGLGEVLAVIEGTLDVTVHQGTARLRGPSGKSGVIFDQPSLTASQGIAADRDASLSYRVTGAAPATFFVLTIAPLEA